MFTSSDFSSAASGTFNRFPQGVERLKCFGVLVLSSYSQIHRHLLLLLDLNISFRFWK